VTTPEKLARIFKVLSVDARVRMIEMLKHRSLCVNALAQALEITPAAVSQHLRVLRDADVVTADRRGYYVHFKVNEATLAEWNKTARVLLEKNESPLSIAP
jgi:ArsR family transcriptional regulator